MADQTNQLRDFPFAWFREHLLADILPHWLKGAVTPNGFFWPQLDRAWARHGSGLGTLVSQSRLLFVFSTGYRLTGDNAYLDATAVGADFLLKTFEDRLHGGWCWSCDPSGKILDDHKNCYGHAFVIFGLAHALRATGDSRYGKSAEQTYDIIRTKFRDSHGGLAWRLSADFQDGDTERSQNPMMHLFEALSELADASGKREYLDEARGIADFLFSPIASTELPPLPEVYAMDWRPKPTADGGYSAGGHLFEWAYLLSAAVERGLPASYLQLADRCLRHGITFALDRDNPGVVTRVSLEGQPLDYRKSFWEPCEAIRALLHFAVLRGRPDLLPICRNVLQFTRAHFIDPEYGGWYANLTREGTPVAVFKGSEWKVDYHSGGMCAEALRLGA